ncbi:MAG TPA: helix-hairpin-helix domain-containing protein, partial [Actinomycetota bacterium]|nr:helix-hairpin-helix domain-containing protein [Actinomycetota bacterium]
DLDLINLAEVVLDGTKIDVPVAGHAPSGVSPALGPSTPASVDLNTADQTALESIPGVGPVTATAILQKRAELGRFDSFDQLLEVTGIGPATLEAIRPYVTI